MDDITMHMLGYITDEQWKDALDYMTPSRRGAVIALMRRVETNYGVYFDKANRYLAKYPVKGCVAPGGRP